MKQRKTKAEISVVVPTYNRPDALRRALGSLAAQTPPKVLTEIIVADNSSDANAQNYVREFAETSPFPVRYVSAPKAGVANARNAALRVAEGHFIAFLDDDQIAAPNWLSVIHTQAVEKDAAVVFTQIQAQSRTDVRHKAAYLAFFDRTRARPGSAVIEEFYGCGSSLLDLRKCTLPVPPFCPSTNQTGGEDDLLFSALQKQGIRVAWTDETHVVEDVPPARMTRNYIRKRSFAYGQGPSRICASPDNYSLFGLLRWMAIGAAQFAVYTPLYGLTTLMRSPKSIWYMRKSAEGAGKFFWFERMRPKLYGTALPQLPVIDIAPGPS